MINENDIAQDFSLVNYDEKIIKLSDFKGKKVVLYFYPKDDTPGCTKEACSFRDYYDQIIERGAIVIGVSPDSTKSHNKFKEKYNLQFFLLSDSDHKIAEIYGAWGEKTMYGKKYYGIIRTTIIIDGNGKISKIFPKVTPDGHGEEVLKYI